ncbi:hypothetical protein IW138_003706 [Coemansia sp. RSA 986]|nr:hypothetical protein IW138_003706 [Coemansia sp. RSA 986]
MSLLQQGSLTHNSSDSNVLSPHGAGHGSYGGRVLTRGGGSNSNTPNHGSRTMVITPSDEATEPARFLPGGVLFLRGSDVSSEEGQQPRSSRGPQVRWTDDTVDNENMNKKKSKVCCIYRKERQFGESDSDETDSSSCSNSDSDDSPNEYERMPRLALFDQALFGTSGASVDVCSLVALCFRGIPEVSGLRALCWQILLGYLPPDRQAWSQVLRSSRESYAQLVGEIGDSLEATGDTGPAQSLLDQIRADIQRTMPDIAALRNRIGSPNDHEAPNNGGIDNNRNDDNNYDDDDDARCNTIVSDLTALSMESADSSATITPAVPRRQHSSTALPCHLREAGSPVHIEEVGNSRPCGGVNRLRRSLGEKIAAATAQDAKMLSDGERITLADTRTRGKLGIWLLSNPQTHAEALARILFVHAQFNKGVGYVQGMNELLAPLYYVLLSSSSSSSSDKGATGQVSECEADAFHLFILAMRGEHLDMFISALDTAPASASRGSLSPRHRSASPCPAQQSVGSISEHELLVHHQHALAAAKAHRLAHASAFALPVTAYKERNKQTQRNSLIRGSAASTDSKAGGLQGTIRHWWVSYVRTADEQLWSRLDSLGVHPEHFAVRWLLVWGAREFPLPDVLVLWDSLMANRARLAARENQTYKQGSSGSGGYSRGSGASSVVYDTISSAIAFPAANTAQSGCGDSDAYEQRSTYSAVRTTIGKLRCEVRLCQGMSGDDSDGSQLGFLFDFFTAVLVAMRDWLLVSPFERCVSLLQNLPRDIPELEMRSLIGSALQQRSDRAERRAVKACRAILSTVDRTKLGLAAGMDDSRGLEALHALYGPLIPRRISQNAGMHSKFAGSGGKVSRFFGELSGRIGQTMQTLLSVDSDDDNDIETGSNVGSGFGDMHPLGMPFQPGSLPSAECLLLVVPVPEIQDRMEAKVAIYEVAHFDNRTLTATAVSLGECDGRQPSLANVRVASLDSAAAPVVSVRLPAPYAVAAPTRIAVPRQKTKDGRDGYAHRPASSTPNMRGTASSERIMLVVPSSRGNGLACGSGDEELLTATATDSREMPWWKDIPAAPAHRRPDPVHIELCDFDSDGDDMY